MIKGEHRSLLRMYAVSPVHAGSGASIATVDLPIQRERHTNWPHIQASAVKGAMRSHFRKFNSDEGGLQKGAAFLCNVVFGSDEQDKWDSKSDGETLPGAISVSDAKLFAFPVRSNVAPFVWVTCPAVLKRLAVDLELAGLSGGFQAPDVSGDSAVPLTGNLEGRVVLEDALVNCSGSAEIKEIGLLLQDVDRCIIVSDEMFDYCVSQCTEVQAQIKINSRTGTAGDGSLRYQELLPSDTVMYSIVLFSMQRYAENEFKVDMVRDFAKKVFTDGSFFQIGGDETLGRGMCRINWHEGGQK